MNAYAQHLKRKTWNIHNSMLIASVCAQLRTHASRALHEAGYKTLESRRNHAEKLRALAKRIEERRKLRLDAKWWVDRATALLDQCDKDNPEEKTS